jgi:hypothetical protein
MLRTMTLAAFAVLASAGTASASCAGADPAITSVAVRNVAQSGGVNRYALVGTVVNAGSQGQPNDTLQFVDIYQNPGEKLDAKGIPPLQPGQSYTFSYVMLRSTEAGKGTTTLRFKLDIHQPAASMADCDGSNDSFTLTF